MLRSKAPDLRVALWWAEANTHLQGFRGLAEGVRRISGLWSQLIKNAGKDNDSDEDPPAIAADALETYLLQVPLADAHFTFTTVINSRCDPELESEIRVEAAKEPGRWGEVLAQLQAVEAEMVEFQASIPHGNRVAEAFWQLRRTLADMRQTMSAWATPESEPGATPPDAAPQPAPAKEPEYAIHLWIEGVSGESADARHKEWIVGVAYRQSLQRPTAADEGRQPTFEIEKNLDRASPALYLAVHIGRVFGKVIVEVCRGTEQSERFLRIEMNDAVVTEVRQTAAASSGCSRPTETLVFEYQRIQWTYTKLRQPDALREGNTSSAWTRNLAGSEPKVRSRASGGSISQKSDQPQRC
jgi:type VI secretion system secreted protein Hcp